MRIQKSRRLVFLAVTAFIAGIFAFLITKSWGNILYLVRRDTSTKIIGSRVIYSTQNDFQNALAKKNINVKSIILSSDSATLVVRLDDRTYVYFDFASDPTAQAEKLNAILSRLAIEGNPRKPGVIDLRFKNPIIKF